jgi:hypothetical protein
MKQRIYGFRLLATVLATFAVSGSAIAAESLPFKGQSTGTVTVVGFDPVAGAVSVRGAGAGEATHLGHFNVTSDVKIFLTTGAVVGIWTFTAANGDMIVATGTGGGIDPTHGFGTFTIVSGTGRFQGATGSYQQIITFAEPGDPTVTVNPYSEVLTGRISFGPK